MQTSGNQRREIAKLYRRHCERSEAIHLTTCRAMDCFAALAMTGERAGFAPSLHPEVLPKRRLERRGHHQRAERDCPRNRLETQTDQMCILRCSKIINVAPSNGQWQFGRLVCNGASGMQASGARARVPGK